MATKVVHVSDLSGREAEDEGQLGRLVVLEHPDIGEPATLEVFPDRYQTYRALSAWCTTRERRDPGHIPERQPVFPLH